MKAFPSRIKAYDAERNRFVPASLVNSDGKLSIERRSPEEPGSVPEEDDSLYVSPGWVDMHTHVCYGIGWLSVPPDAIGLGRGVFAVGDAGSVGADTFPAVKRYLIPATATKIKVWLNINSVGLVHMPEYFDETLLDVGKAVACCLENRDVIIGVKVRMSGRLLRGMGLKPLLLAKKAAKEAELPLMVHIGEPPPEIDEILGCLENGDIVTHCFHGGKGQPWLEDGSPIGALRYAIERGVRLDVGNGRLSFSFECCEKAVRHDRDLEVSISSDIHANSVSAIKGLATVMSKLLYCGYSLENVVRGVTKYPADLLSLRNWCDENEYAKHATVFRVDKAPPGEFLYDAKLKRRKPDRLVCPVGIIREGVYSGLYIS